MATFCSAWEEFRSTECVGKRQDPSRIATRLAGTRFVATPCGSHIWPGSLIACFRGTNLCGNIVWHSTAWWP
jgi:hypothetical protein